MGLELEGGESVAFAVGVAVTWHVSCVMCHGHPKRMGLSCQTFNWGDKSRPAWIMSEKSRVNRKKGYLHFCFRFQEDYL